MDNVKYSIFRYKIEVFYDIHGVVWVDWEKCEAIPDEIVEVSGESVYSVVINHMERIKSVLDDIKNDHYEKGVTEEKLESLVKFADNFYIIVLPNN